MPNDRPNDVAKAIADYITRSMGQLTARQEALKRELAAVEGEIDAVRAGIARQLSSLPAAAPVPRARRLRIRTVSKDTRQKLAEAARRRWAKAKRAGKKSLG